MKVLKYITLLLFLYGSFTQSLPQSIKDKLDLLLKNEFFEQSIIATDIYDLTADQYLYRVNSKLLLHPASNMKLLTSITGLLSLGSDYQFLTSLYYDGDVIGNTLFGNLYVEGGCDPEFRTEDLMNFILAVKALNINSIVGNIYADLSFKDSIYWGAGWMWDDDPSTDAPYLSALNINGNSVTVSVLGSNVGQAADVFIIPRSKFFTLQNRTLTVLKKEEENFFITRNWFNRKNEIVVTGKVSLEKENNIDGDKKLNVINPELYFLTLFKETLINNGISVTGEIGIANLPFINKYLASVPTSFMTTLMNVNKNSNNLSAEMVLYAFSEKYFGRPANSQNGIKLINDLIRLSGHNPEKYRIFDGSGVSHYNLVSAELMTDILRYIYTNENNIFQALIESLPIAGVDGTLAKRMTTSSAYRKVRAKTGTLSGVSALSGYVTAANGNQIAFSILIQNHVSQTSKAREIQDEICKILADHK